ncbi:MAG TPA: DUF2652 domain-containing protein [Casimicrobiaceae bacterium]|jgi:hypothetical protein|nr:DUF2652 domain-containing protein [Casimicrobiaceae bacterium]
MTAQPTLMLIADIAGYTKFMKFHQASLAHAQEIVARLLEVVIDAAGPSLKLAKLEGDAAFFYMPAPRNGQFDPALIAGHAAAIYRAFHMRAADLQLNTLCPCDGCQQSGNLKIKLVGHLGGVAMQKVKQMTELAGVDVIVVHRMLKNSVPVPEYLLMTKPVHAIVGSPLHEQAAPFALDLDDLGPTEAFYVDLSEFTHTVPAPQKLPPWRRLARHISLGLRTLPRELGFTKSCVGFRNVPDAH